MELFSFIGERDSAPQPSTNASPKCYNRQLTAKAKLASLKSQGFSLEATHEGVVLKQPNGRKMEAFKIDSLVKECFGDKCELVKPSEDPLFSVSELGNGKFLVKFNKEIF